MTLTLFHVTPVAAGDEPANRCLNTALDKEIFTLINKAEYGSDHRALLTDLSASVKEGTWLKESHQKEIAAIFSDSTLSSAEKAQKSFDVYLNARLSVIDAADRETILKIVAEAKIKKTKSEINGAYNLWRGKLGLALPEGVANTLLEKAILVHEIEHAIQVSAVKNGAAWPRLRLAIDSVEGRYLLEDGAMSAEYAYLSLTSKSERDALLQSVENNPKLNKSSRALAVRMLKNSDENIENYLAAQRADGRYSRNGLLKARIVPMIGPAALSTILIGAAGACDSMTAKDGDFEPTLFFEKICLGLIGRDVRLWLTNRLYESRKWLHCTSDVECRVIIASCSPQGTPTGGYLVNEHNISKARMLYEVKDNLQCQWPDKPKCVNQECKF